MDFFDPIKQKRHALRLAVGYALIGLALILATTILLYRAYGFGLDKEGRVIQNGLVFVSSHPRGADIYVNDKKFRDQSNTRLALPAAQYIMELKRNGYRNWKRVVTVEGGSVERFDYPFLFPAKLATTTIKQYPAIPSLYTESPDRHWLIVGQPGQNAFDLFDLRAKSLSPQALAVPVEVLAAGSTTKTWEVTAWSTDNRHLVLKRSYERPGQAASEYILFDRENPALSQNLSVILGFTPTSLQLKNGAYDQYYLHDQSSGQLFTATLKKPTPQPYIHDVLAYAVDGNSIVFATAQDAPAGKVLVRILQGDGQPLTIRLLAVDNAYFLDAAIYDGVPYIAIGAPTEGRIFVYKDPIRALKRDVTEVPAPVHILKVNAPTYLSFSANKRFVMAENAGQFAVYDAETKRGYKYQAKVPMDAVNGHATWMDGFRLLYASGGKLAVFDYDGTNTQTLMPTAPGIIPLFDRDYRFAYTINPQNALTSTALLVPADQ